MAKLTLGDFRQVITSVYGNFYEFFETDFENEKNNGKQK